MALRMLTSLLLITAAILNASASMMDFITRDVYPGIGEYFYIGMPLNWTEALLLCQASDAHLAIIDSDDEAAAIKQIMANHGASFIHLGFHDLFLEGKYNTVLGHPINKACRKGNHWAPRSPRGSTTHNCGGFTEAGFMDTKCEDKRMFVCEITSSNSGDALPGYTLIPNHGYYKLHPNSTSWVEADEKCREEGTHLVILNSQREADALKDKFSPIPTMTFHVGVHRFHGGNDNFMTVTGGSLRNTGYMNWVIGYPFDSFLNRPFVFYYVGSRTDAPGLATHNLSSPFICERELN